MVTNVMRSFVEERRNIVDSSSTRALAAHLTGAHRRDKTDEKDRLHTVSTLL